MNGRAFFGRYWEGDSPVHMLDPRTKLLSMFVLIIALFLAKGWPSMLLCSLFVLAVFKVAGIPYSEALRSIAPILFIAILAAVFNVFYFHGGSVLVDLGWIRITTEGLSVAAFIAVRIVLLLLLGSLLTMTTTTMDITEATERLLSPLAKIGVPIHEFAFVMGTALRFLPRFAEEFQTIRMAQTARGARLSTSPIRGVSALTSLMIPLFASVFRHADTLSAAMDARCYHGASGRTRLRPMRFALRDLVAAVLVVALCALVVFVNICTFNMLMR